MGVPCQYWDMTSAAPKYEGRKIEAYRKMRDAYLNEQIDRKLKGHEVNMEMAARLIKYAIHQHFEADGDTADWTPCEHCDEGWYVDVETLDIKGICYQCHGKAWQSEADRRRNWGYQARQTERYDA